MQSSKEKERYTEDNHLLQTYIKRDLTIVSGIGAIVTDINDEEYIDCIGGWGTANIGHGNTYVAEAISQQAIKIISCPGILYNDTREQAIERLMMITPKSLNQIFFTNSGTESVEAAIKFIIHTTGKNHFISTIRGFHGRTLGSLALTHKTRYRKEFESILLNTSFVPFNNIKRLKDAVTDDTAGIILEVIQGEGGVHIGNPAYFKEVRELCDELGIIMIIDEIQTGFGRTGTMFAFEQMDIIPDILCMAKSMAGGVPMGAIVTNSKIKSAVGIHGSTFGGNPLASAACTATIDFILNNNLINSTREKGDYLISQLRSKLNTKLVRDVRGKGLMIGIDLRKKVGPYVRELMKHNILVIPTGLTVIRLLPPLVITYDQLNNLIEIIVKVLEDHN